VMKPAEEEQLRSLTSVKVAVNLSDNCINLAD